MSLRDLSILEKCEDLRLELQKSQTVRDGRTILRYTVNALTAADSVIIPIQCEYYALEGLNQVLNTIGLVQEGLNPELDIEGIVFTMYDGRNKLSQQVVESVKQNFQGNIYDTLIPRNVRLAEAPSHGVPITEYESSSTGAESYRRLAAELMSKGDDIYG